MPRRQRVDPTKNASSNSSISSDSRGKRSDRQTLAWLNVSLGFTAMFLEVTQKYSLGVVRVVAILAFA
jgi:hypothetical protein